MTLFDYMLSSHPDTGISSWFSLDRLVAGGTEVGPWKTDQYTCNGTTNWWWDVDGWITGPKYEAVITAGSGGTKPESMEYVHPVTGLSVIVLESELVTPDPPTGVAATDNGFDDRVRVTWNAASHATAYRVWRNTSNDLLTASEISGLDITGTCCYYDDTTATVGIAYWYSAL